MIATTNVFGQKDTLKVMTYNVLYYGNGCQGPNGKYHEYFKTIVKYTNPDIVSLVKLASIPVSEHDKYATAPLGFADSIIKYAMNSAFPDRYAYCPFTNEAKSTNIVLLVYDKHKLGYAGMVSSYVNIIDFNTYKLYYKDPNLEKTHDTTFLYLTLNHDKSGDEFEQVRTNQISGEQNEIRKHFSHLPNMINLGDFNVRTSKEPFYQLLTAGSDTSYRFYDPVFVPDHSLSYPAEWDHEAAYSPYFTTSTRASADIPNSCGSGGGAKCWYDHIFLSKWILNNSNYIDYIPHSYKTIGNDGNHFKMSINNSNINKNNSVPPDMIEALYQMSNKYPVMLSLEVSYNTNGVSPKDPEIFNVPIVYKAEVKASENQTDGKLNLIFDKGLIGQEMTVECFDTNGASCMKKDFVVKNNEMEFKFKPKQGTYLVQLRTSHNIVSEFNIVRK